MIYLIYDHVTGELVDRSSNPAYAEDKCNWWEETYAYINGHTFGWTTIEQYKRVWGDKAYNVGKNQLKQGTA